ncbi:hypothetical protein QL285_093335 [Trifolium repens]|nr:hypothetical protein QL285_093335 [Trifolium repens]
MDICLVFTYFTIVAASSSKMMLLIFSFSIHDKASLNPKVSARTTLYEQAHTRVAAPTHQPSSLHKTRPKPQWPTSKRMCIHIELQIVLGRETQLLLLRRSESCSEACVLWFQSSEMLT